MVGDGDRGGALEHLLSKLLYLSPTTQIVGMSATIGNLLQVGRWLRATTYSTDFRPVPLRQMVLTCLAYSIDICFKLPIAAVYPFALSPRAD